MGFKFFNLYSLSYQTLVLGIFFFFFRKQMGVGSPFFTFSFCPILHNRLMYSQITERQVASKEVIKDWMNLCVGLFRSTDIYWNICSTPVVGKALCLIWPLQPTFKNTCVGLNSIGVHKGAADLS